MAASGAPRPREGERAAAGPPFARRVVLSPPSLRDNTATLDRLAKALARELGVRPAAPLPLLAGLVAAIRAAGPELTAILAPGPAGPVLLEALPGDRSALPPAPGLAARARLLPARPWPLHGLGLALDLGSTHLVGSLHDQATGARLAEATRLNPQVATGADILTRIHAAADPAGHARLRRELVGAAADLARELCARAGRNPRELTGLVAAGNPTMTHFFLGLDVQSLCREPYIPAVNRPPLFFTADLGLVFAPGAVGYCLPNAGAYFGGDLVAGILAAGLHRGERPSLLVDVGTNAEVVLGNRDWLLACAGAAGPALEGGVARHGVVARPGAIEGVRIDPQSGEPTLAVIPGPDGRPPKPVGLCGSGLLQLLAQLYLAGFLDRRGKFRTMDHPRLVATDEGPGYLVAAAGETGDGLPIVVNEVEIDILLRSKAAMYTILRTITLEVGIEFAELESFFVAGAFGKVIDPATAITLGMLPDLPRERFRSLGNSSLRGCQLLLADPGRLTEVAEVAERLTYLELNVNQALMNRFSAARFIPHTDASRFPSVPIP